MATLRLILDFVGAEPNPARGGRVKLPRTEMETVEPPATEQMELILKHAPTRWRLPLRVLEQTGMRVGELQGLAWRDVDVSESRFRIRRGKTLTAGDGSAFRIG
jgi:integrase